MFAVSKSPLNSGYPKARPSGASGPSTSKAGIQEQRGYPQRSSEMSGSRPPCTQTNGRRCQAAAGPRGDLQDSLQHEAVANFLQLAWKDVCFKLEQSQQAAHEGKHRRVVYYREKEPDMSRECDDGSSSLEA